MTTARGMYPLDALTPSLLRQEPLLAGTPAPAGTLFVLGEDGGYAAAGTRLHVVEVLVSEGRGDAGPARPGTGTRDLGLPITPRERLVLVALFRYVLARADNAHPLSWKETSRVLEEVPGQRGWTERKAEAVVDTVRHKLTAIGVTGLTTDTAAPEAIKGNLQRALLDTATLVPPDLRLLHAGLPEAAA